MFRGWFRWFLRFGSCWENLRKEISSVFPSQILPTGVFCRFLILLTMSSRMDCFRNVIRIWKTVSDDNFSTVNSVTVLHPQLPLHRPSKALLSRTQLQLSTFSTLQAPFSLTFIVLMYKKVKLCLQTGQFRNFLKIWRCLKKLGRCMNKQSSSYLGFGS